jgi:hypothetical protein
MDSDIGNLSIERSPCVFLAESLQKQCQPVQVGRGKLKEPPSHRPILSPKKNAEMLKTGGI